MSAPQQEPSGRAASSPGTTRENYAARMLSAGTVGDVVRVARDVLADLAGYRYDPDPATWRDAASRRAVAMHASGEVDLARLQLRHVALPPRGAPVEFREVLHYVKLIVCSALAPRISGEAAGIGQYAAGQLQERFPTVSVAFGVGRLTAQIAGHHAEGLPRSLWPAADVIAGADAVAGMMDGRRRPGLRSATVSVRPRHSAESSDRAPGSSRHGVPAAAPATVHPASGAGLGLG